MFCLIFNAFCRGELFCSHDVDVKIDTVVTEHRKNFFFSYEAGM